jgi:multidrug efflux pump subunit AcrA (membrane-fusion protein)
MTAVGRILVGAVLLLGAHCHGAHSAPEEHEEPVAVEVRCVPVGRTDVETTTTLRGRLAAPPGGDLPVASQVAGRIVEVQVHEGDHLTAGAVVAFIDDASSRDALRQADATVVQSKAALANADATLDRTR